MVFQRAIGAVALIAAGISGYLGFVANGETLRLEMPALVDVGTVPAGSMKSVSVKILNPCGFPIEILELSRSCSCTEIKLSQAVIKPREKATLAIHVAGSEKGVDSRIVAMFHAVGGSQVANQTIKIAGSAPAETGTSELSGQ